MDYKITSLIDNTTSKKTEIVFRFSNSKCFPSYVLVSRLFSWKMKDCSDLKFEKFLIYTI